MEKRIKTKAEAAIITNGELQLPEVILQRVQSFLTSKHAAQTTLLSKSWYKAWLTRPNLDFDDRDFQINELDKFTQFQNNTIQRYQQSNLKIQSFSLHVTSLRDDPSLKFEYQLILKVLKMGPTRLSFLFDLPCFQFFDLPHEVFRSENLVHLSVKGCTIDLGPIQGSDVRGSNHLVLATCRRKRVVRSSCPLIETLSLRHIHEIGKLSALPFWDGRIDLGKFHKLRSLELLGVDIPSWFFSDMSSKFPCLKDLNLVLHYLSVLEEIRISSRSIECLRFQASYRLRARFDVPSIHKLTFEGSANASLSFGSTSGEWESHVSISRRRPSHLWFCKLNKLLTKLSRSKIHLSLNILSKKCFDYDPGDFQGLPRHEVENLTVDIEYPPSMLCSALYDGLFRLCRPKFVTQYLLLESLRYDKTNNDFLCKTLVRGMNGSCSTPSHCMYGLHDLEEVNAEIYEESVAKWRALPLQSLLDGSLSPEYRQKVRFQLKWRAIV